MTGRLGVVFAMVLAAVVASDPVPDPGPVFDPTVQTGSCDWTCGSAKFRTFGACDAACDSPCERLCW